MAALPRPGAISTFLITTLTQWLSHRIIKNINKHLSSLSKQEHLEPELRVHRVPPSARAAPRRKLSAVSHRGCRGVLMLTGGSRGWGSDTSQPPGVPGFGTSICDPLSASPSHSSSPAEDSSLCAGLSSPRAALNPVLCLLLLPHVAEFQLPSAVSAQFCCFFQTPALTFFASTNYEAFALLVPLLLSALHRVPPDACKQQRPRCGAKTDQPQHTQLRRRLPGWFPASVNVVRRFIP